MNKRNNELLARARELAARGYKPKITTDILTTGEQVYLAENPELPGCRTQADTREEALDRLNQVRVDYIYFLLEDGIEVPEPMGTTEGTSADPAMPTPILNFGSSTDTTEQVLEDEATSPKSIKFSVVEGKIAASG